MENPASINYQAVVRATGELGELVAFDDQTVELRFADGSQSRFPHDLIKLLDLPPAAEKMRMDYRPRHLVLRHDTPLKEIAEFEMKSRRVMSKTFPVIQARNGSTFASVAHLIPGRYGIYLVNHQTTTRAQDGRRKTARFSLYCARRDWREWRAFLTRVINYMEAHE